MKKMIIVLLNLIVLSTLEAKNLELKKIYVDGHEEVILFDENVESITIYSSDAHQGEVKDIVGLNQFKNLTELDFPMINYNGDWSFLYGLTTLKTLFINSSSKNLKSIKFLESLTNLEIFGLDLIINEKYKEDFLREKIDLGKLNKIDKIYYYSRFLKEDYSGWYFTGRIPNFVNVKNKPKIYLDNNGIEYLTFREKILLKQYSEVNLYSNPISENKKPKR